MKIGQLKQCNMRNVFLKESYSKFGEDASRKPFLKKTKLSITLDQQSENL